MLDEALYSAEAFCECEKPGMLKEPPGTRKIRIEVNRYHAAKSVHLARGEFMLRMRGESGIANQPNFRVLFQPRGKGECIGRMSLHAESQSLETAHGQETIKGAGNSSYRILEESQPIGD